MFVLREGRHVRCGGELCQTKWTTTSLSVIHQLAACSMPNSGSTFSIRSKHGVQLQIHTCGLIAVSSIFCILKKDETTMDTYFTSFESPTEQDNRVAEEKQILSCEVFHEIIFDWVHCFVLGISTAFWRNLKTDRL